MTGAFDNTIDNSLVIKIKHDDTDAFRSLYDRYSWRIYYLSKKYLHSDEEAEELVQTVFMNLWEHRASLDENMPVRSYIYKSAVNYVCNHLKKKAIRSRFIELAMKRNTIQSNGTYEQVFFHDLESTVNFVVEKLPPQQQKIFELSRNKGLTHEEIAGMLHLSERTVKNHIYRALKFIKTCLKGEVLLVLLF